MLIGENILLALNGLRANKMRSLLTMLGIIIGIASVIAIMTLGDSISSSVTDSMASMGANNITVGVSQKSTSQETTSSGMTFSMGPRFTKMTEDDYISDEMLDSLEKRYGDSIQGFSLTESVGSGTAQLGSLYAYVNATGVNEANLENTDLTLLAGRTLTERDQIEAKKVCLVSDYLVNNLFNGNNMAAVGQTVDVLFNSRYYTYTIVGVYKYEESDMGFSSSSEEDTETILYLPLQTAKNQTHNTNGYSQFTILTASGVSATSFCDTVENYMNERYYQDNESFEISAMSMESIVESMTSMLSTISLAIAAIGGNFPFGRRYRRYEYYAGIYHGTYQRNRHQKSTGSNQWLHPSSVHHRIYRDLYRGRYAWNYSRNDHSDSGHQYDGLRGQSVHHRYRGVRHLLIADRCVLRILPGQ